MSNLVFTYNIETVKMRSNKQNVYRVQKIKNVFFLTMCSAPMQVINNGAKSIIMSDGQWSVRIFMHIRFHRT